MPLKINLNDAYRLWSKIDRGRIDECWIYKGGTDGGRYGRFWLNEGTVSPHRITWQLANGLVDISDGFLVCHKCDVTLCCNPNHLFLGTQHDNLMDASDKGRNPHGESHGMHKLTVDHVVDIRRLSKIGVPDDELAEMFNVTRQNIHYVVKRATWQKVVP